MDRSRAGSAPSPRPTPLWSAARLSGNRSRAAPCTCSRWAEKLGFGKGRHRIFVSFYNPVHKPYIMHSSWIITLSLTSLLFCSPQIGKNTGSTKPAIFMDCGIHAREWISPAFCQWFVQEVKPNSLAHLHTVKILIKGCRVENKTLQDDATWREIHQRQSGLMHLNAQGCYCDCTDVHYIPVSAHSQVFCSHASRNTYTSTGGTCTCTSTKHIRLIYPNVMFSVFRPWPPTEVTLRWPACWTPWISTCCLCLT